MLENENSSGYQKAPKKSKVKVRVIEKAATVKLPEMIKIPAGEFLMGISEDQVDTLYYHEEWAQEWKEEGNFYVEMPMHYVELPDYEIGKFPVTNKEYYKFVWEVNYRIPKGWSGFKFPEGLDEHPVVGVNMNDANEYVKWLNSKTGYTYRLPTEAEWEKAARGEDGRIYPWGDDFDPWRCNTLESGLERTTPVDSYSPSGLSPYGVAGMAGNVWEWTSSRNLPYPFQPDPDPPESGKLVGFVVRGGAWYYSKKLARTTVREVYMPDFISPALGFRVVRQLD